MKKYFGLFLIATVILLTSCAKQAPLNLGMPTIYEPPIATAETAPEPGLTPVSETGQPDPKIVVVEVEDEITSAPMIGDDASQRLIALEKRVSDVEKKAISNSNVIQSVTMRVAELEILFGISSPDYIACIVGNFGIGQSNITDDLACKIIDKCLPYFKEEANKKGNNYRIAYVVGYGDIGGREDLTKALSSARAENAMNFLLDNIGKKAINVQIVQGGPTEMFGSANYNRCVVIIAKMVYKSSIKLINPKQ